MVYGIGKVQRIRLSLLTTGVDCELLQLSGAIEGESGPAGKLSFRSGFGDVDSSRQGVHGLRRLPKGLSV